MRVVLFTFSLLEYVAFVWSCFPLLHHSFQSEIIKLSLILVHLVVQVLKLTLILCFRFLAENKSKKQAAEKESGRDKEQVSVDREPEKSGKTGELFNISSFSDAKDDKAMPFFDAGEEEFLKCHGLKERDIEEDAEGKPALTARDIFGKWGDESSFSTSYPSAEKSRGDAEEAEPVDHVEEELFRSRKHKKEEKSKKKEKKEKEKPRRSLSPPTTSREKDRPLFPGAFPPREQSPAQRLFASKEDFELRVATLDELPRYVQHEVKLIQASRSSYPSS